jgi:hypothetical protein
MILDQSDPAKLGMFSKYGRFTSEKYPIILKKEEILKGERKTFKVRDVDASTDSEEEKREGIAPQPSQKPVAVMSARQEREAKKPHVRKAAAKGEKKSAQLIPPPPTRYRPKHIKL